MSKVKLENKPLDLCSLIKPGGLIVHSVSVRNSFLPTARLFVYVRFQSSDMALSNTLSPSVTTGGQSMMQSTGLEDILQLALKVKRG